MFSRNNFSLFVSILTVISTLAGDIRDDVETAIHSKYGVEINLTHQKLTIPKSIKNEIQAVVKQKFFRDELHSWNISLNDSTCYTALLDNSLGKSMPITFLVILNEQGHVDYTEIIKYREPYGGEINSYSWTHQFVGSRTTSGYNVGKDIDGISGATISVHSVTKGIHKLILLYPMLKEQIRSCQP
jgi:Na+-translocating ferredoxin:NAD+ oxidoreductase RnfG subunit